jgi:hypothetical protein
VIKKNISMNRFRLTTSLTIFPPLMVGRSGGAGNLVTLQEQEARNGYGHKKLQPLESTDPPKGSLWRSIDEMSSPFGTYAGYCVGHAAVLVAA